MSEHSDKFRHPQKEMLMLKIGGFAASSVARGFAEDRFAALPDRDKRDLLKLMARVAEMAYRRGVQQGAEIPASGLRELRGNLRAWRYGRSLDLSPDASTPAMETSLERLATECRYDLRRLGLPITFTGEERQARRTKRCWVGYTTAQMTSGRALSADARAGH